MIELRKDYILNRWVIISEKRGDRPKQFKKIDVVKDDQLCYFCPGNENLTPPEIGRVEDNGKWKVRWFPNKFPAVGLFPTLGKSKKPFEHLNAYGYHEVIVETNDHSKQLWDLSPQETAGILKIYASRIKELSKKKNVGYVVVFKNHGREGGTSIVHTHTQLMTVPMVPLIVQEEIKASRKGKQCTYCSVIKKEVKSPRFIAQNNDFVAFCPYASRFNYEAWIFPKKHITSLMQCNEAELASLAEMLQKILGKIKTLDVSYNFLIHYGPKNDLHFHIEITPRAAIWAGFEISSDIIINSVSPEQAAEFYKSP